MIIDVLTALLPYLDFTTFTVFFIITYVTWLLYEGRNLPPGPWGLPIVGYLPFMRKGPPEEVFRELSKKYGNIIRHMNSDGAPWRDHRRFILSTFRDYGMGKLSLEPRIMEEVHFFLEALAKQKGEPFDFSYLLGLSTSNIICTLEFGKRFDYTDPWFIHMRDLQDEALYLFISVSARAFFPWLIYVPYVDRLTHMSRLREIGNAVNEFFREQMQEHKVEYHENSKKVLTERNDIIKKTGDEDHFNDHELKGTLAGFFGAGTETTSTTLRWALHLLLINPEIKTKVQKEIDEVIGMERNPTMSDKNQMVYTEAVMLEAQRFGSIAALNLPHTEIGNAVNEFFREQMQEHKVEYHENSKKVLTERNDIIKKTGDEDHFNDHELKGTLAGFFGAGTETTSTTLRWALHLLLINPEIKTKVQKEIDEVIGMERNPTMSDKNQMVYTEAVMLEAQRFGSIAALNLPHTNLEETELCGYRIPKRSMIMTNLWAVHHDSKLWDQPEKFIPERFINKESKIEKPEYLIPFGIGKRACVGESLARMELFLYFTSLLQRFTLHPTKGVTPVLSYESVAARRPKAYKLCAVQRKGYSV